MRRETAYLSLGSNVGDRFAILKSALESLRQHPQISLISTSSFYETEPQDVVDQPWFLNMVAAINTDAGPENLLAVLQEMERTAGRIRAQELRRGPRTLDLDILLYGALAMKTPGLTIPHPRMTERRFVLEPLVEIAPELVHPESRVLLTKHLQAVSKQGLRLVIDCHRNEP